MIALLLAALLQAQPPAAAPVEMGVLVRPAVVTVGEPFVVMVRVRAPRGASIAFPAGPDSGLSVEAVDPRDVRASPDTTVVERTAAYRLVAWDTGAVATHLGAVTITMNARSAAYPIHGDSIRVRSVLPADTAQQQPKPARDIVPAGLPWWVWAALIAGVLGMLGLAWWWWRRRRIRRAAMPRDAFAEAQAAFARVDALGLLDAGERGRYVTLTVDVLRDYLAARVPAAERALTSHELVDALREQRGMPMTRLVPLLSETDLVKFARRPISSERARELAHDVRAVVEHVEVALRALAESDAEHAA